MLPIFATDILSHNSGN